MSESARRVIVVVAILIALVAAPGTLAGTALAETDCLRQPDVCEPVVNVVESSSELVRIDSDEGGFGTMAVGGVQSDYYWRHTETIEYLACSTSKCTLVGKIYTEHKINLNGRQSNWTQKSTRTSGPAFKMNHRWDGIAANGPLPDTSFVGGWKSHADSVYDSSHTTSRSYYHEDADKYWYNFKRSWSASGWSGWTWVHPKQASHQFVCPKNKGNCKF